MKPVTISNHTFNWGAHTYVMGILNITPDSFSGDGLLSPPVFEENGGGKGGALEQARSFILSGADILDVGGESTRPGSEPVDAEAEMERVIPVVQALSHEFPDMSYLDRYLQSYSCRSGFKSRRTYRQRCLGLAR